LPPRPSARPSGARPHRKRQSAGRPPNCGATCPRGSPGMKTCAALPRLSRTCPAGAAGEAMAESATSRTSGGSALNRRGCRPTPGAAPVSDGVRTIPDTEAASETCAAGSSASASKRPSRRLGDHLTCRLRHLPPPPPRPPRPNTRCGGAPIRARQPVRSGEPEPRPARSRRAVRIAGLLG